MEYIAKGKTVEEAIQLALKEKGWRRDEVETEVIDPGHQGLFRKREAVVRVYKPRQNGEHSRQDIKEIVASIKDESELQQVLDQLHQVLDQLQLEQGPNVNKAKQRWIQIDGDRLLFAEDIFQREVVLYPPQKTTLMINGKRLDQPTMLTMEDEVTYGPHPSDLDEWMLLNTSSDGLIAELCLNELAAYELSWNVRETDEQISIFFKEKLREKLPFKLEDVKHWLTQKGIIYGLEEEALSSWVMNSFKMLEPHVIARGTAREDGAPTQFKELYKREPDDKETDDDRESVDWFGLQHVDSVRVGDVILEIIPATPGRDGKNVYGHTIPAKPGKEIPVRMGKGVELTPDERWVIATIDGRPDFVGGKISVEPVFQVTGDLTLETGSIHFIGDVIITGDVQEGLSIEATGNVEIRGSVTQGKIFAGKNVKVGKNVITSEIRAGGHSSVYQQLNSQTEKILNQLELLKEAYQQLQPQLASRAGEISLGRVIKLVLDSKLPQFEEHLKQLKAVCQQSGLEQKELNSWISQLQAKLTGLGPQSVRSFDEVTQLYQQGLEIKQEWSYDHTENHHVEANYIHNSIVRASGNIVVTGAGVYNSQLYTGEAVYVEGSPGVIRGGYLEAGTLVKVREMGVPSGVKGLVHLREAHGKILAERLYPGISFNIKGIKYSQQQEQRYVQVKYDPQAHMIRVSGLSEVK